MERILLAVIAVVLVDRARSRPLTGSRAGIPSGVDAATLRTEQGLESSVLAPVALEFPIPP